MQPNFYVWVNRGTERQGWVPSRYSCFPVPRNGLLPIDSGEKDLGEDMGTFWMFLGEVGKV